MASNNILLKYNRKYIINNTCIHIYIKVNIS